MPNIGMPLHLPRASIKGVEAIPLGGDNDAATNDQRFRVHCIAQFRGPGS